MAIALGVVVALVSLVVIAIPSRGGPGAARSARNADGRGRSSRLRSARNEPIGQLQADHAAKTVTDEEYRRQLLELRVGAAETIRLLDQLGHDDEPQDAPELLTREALEKEIAALRQAGSGGQSEVGSNRGADES